MPEQGAAKQMVDFLADEFLLAMQQQNQQGANIDVATIMQNLRVFQRFCNDYLNMHPPQELMTNLDGGYGVKLANHKVFTIGIPMSEVKGSMQPSSYIPVTGKQTAQDMQQSDFIAVTGQSHLIPPGAIDFSKEHGVKDLTQQQPQIRFDQHDPRTHPSQR